MEQLRLFPSNITPVFPTTRYQGSKTKLVNWIWEQIKDLPVKTFLDAFGGTGVVAYQAKLNGKQVTYNDILKFNYYFGFGLIENKNVTLSRSEVCWLLERHNDIEYGSFVKSTFANIYFTDEENDWIDQTITNIYQLEDGFKFSIAFYALCQACIIKRPYNLFHRKNLYIRFAEVNRSFGNKTTWDKPFSEWFITFVEEANNAVFDNGERNFAYNLDALDVPGSYDLVYIDTPYISKVGVGVDYRDFYHFLEGLAIYNEWPEKVDFRSKHRRLLPERNDWTNKKKITLAFDNLFSRFKDSILVVSYRSDGIPSLADLERLLRKYKREVVINYYGEYKYVLSKNGDSKEILLIGM